jgi:hypothetical protein
MYYRKLCRRINFPNLPQRKQKLKIKTTHIRNSAELRKSKEGAANTDDI